MNAYTKSFDDILEGLLTSWRTQFPDADTSVGSMIFIKCVALASALWSAYRYQDWILRQSFIDECDSSTLDRHAALYDVWRLAGENDASLSSRLLTKIRTPPAGGNKNDWLSWPKDVGISYSYIPGNIPVVVGDVFIDEGARGAGSINVVLTGAWSAPAWINTYAYVAGSVVSWSGRTFQTTAGGVSNGSNPTSDTGVVWVDITGNVPLDLVDTITNHINDVRPVGIWDFLVVPIEKHNANISITVTGTTSVQRVTIAEAINQYIRNLTPGRTLYGASIVSIAIENGALDCTMPTNVAPTWGPISYEMIWPGAITVIAG
jgi:uncharacterized phage protein gp47/JayE